MLEVLVTVIDRVLKSPFAISSYRWESVPCVIVEARQDGEVGRGEGNAIFYRPETIERLAEETRTAALSLTSVEDHHLLPALLGAHGGRSALDSALWSLRARLEGVTVARLAGLPAMRSLTTVNTVGLDSADNMAARAADLAREYPILKLKLGVHGDAERVRAIRAAIPAATRLVIDANSGWSFEELVAITPTLLEAGIEMVEQPLPQQRDQELLGYRSPILLCADESFQTFEDFDYCAARYGMINVKLDKCGGLSAALAIGRLARERGIKLMVGNMLGSSLGMAPAFLFGQLCDLCDLDGPLGLVDDESPPMTFEAGHVMPPQPELWGY
jgi:L-alanine-DL-glutamate epimerase-like enolase superfamily enzyme